MRRKGSNDVAQAQGAGPTGPPDVFAAGDSIELGDAPASTN